MCSRIRLDLAAIVHRSFSLPPNKKYEGLHSFSMEIYLPSTVWIRKAFFTTLIKTTSDFFNAVRTGLRAICRQQNDPANEPDRKNGCSRFYYMSA